MFLRFHIIYNGHTSQSYSESQYVSNEYCIVMATVILLTFPKQHVPAEPEKDTDSCPNDLVYGRQETAARNPRVSIFP